MQDASRHQDDIVFLVGDLNLNLHLPLESWEGRQPKENSFELFFSWSAMAECETVWKNS